ncbi:uncharacterized protein LOC124149221 [Haliotis rufescens]|uniref:uncharacterized protein LOC124149221 n=1 Tax=Haliotis rufescens TaxID=6454 RepID=UPI001EAFE1BC|nr:uncharacterized protein LOC124149221 [Haliotis rufescens]
MFPIVCVLLSLIGVGDGQVQLQPNCPSGEDILRCKGEYVRDLEGIIVNPLEEIYTTNTYFIKPMEWTYYETQQICRFKTQYINYLLCAIDLRRRCMLQDQRQVLMSRARIEQSINYLCSTYKCDECSKIYCDYCSSDRLFQYDCAQRNIPQVRQCMGEYETIPHHSTTPDIEKRTWEFQNYTCKVINTYRNCIIKAHHPCGYYTKNVTVWVSLFARPYICSATTHTASVLLTIGIILSAVIHRIC